MECQNKVDISFKINFKWFEVHILPLEANYISLILPFENNKQ